MALPIWATRGFGYVGTSPRILYVAAGGAVLIWAGLLTLDFRSVRVNRWWKVISGVLVAAILVQSALFLNVAQDVARSDHARHLGCGQQRAKRRKRCEVTVHQRARSDHAEVARVSRWASSAPC